MDVDILYNVEKTCKVCNSTMKNYYYKKHIETKRHLLNIIKHLLKHYSIDKFIRKK